jgi:glucose-6-phosphate isomerase
MIDLRQIIPFDRLNAAIPNAAVVERRLSQLRGAFADSEAYERAVEQGDPLVYSVASVEPADGEGDLHYGIGKIMPGRVGQEYFLTRGHFHQWRPAAEIYIGLTGTGVMLLDSVVYVPGHTAHRTVNVGDMPLTYLGIYPARAGHDYGALAERNFAQVVVENGGKPCVLQRAQFLADLPAAR